MTSSNRRSRSSAVQLAIAASKISIVRDPSHDVILRDHDVILRDHDVIVRDPSHDVILRDRNVLTPPLSPSAQEDQWSSTAL
jgi:pSer/pThr/pTyr-binding forkhead associated (FHA) protein